MRNRLDALLISAVLAAALSAGSAQAVTIDTANNLADGVLSNHAADGPLYGFSGASPFSWSATFVRGDKRGRAIFAFQNNTSTLQSITVTIQAFLNGVRGKFKRGVKATWIGSSIAARLKGGQVGGVSMEKQFAAGETASLLVKFGKAKIKLGSSLGLNVSVTGPGLSAPAVVDGGSNAAPGGEPPVGEKPSGEPPLVGIETPIVTLPDPGPPDTGTDGRVAQSAVPLPASWLLMLTALVGGGLLAVRSRSEHSA